MDPKTLLCRNKPDLMNQRQTALSVSHVGLVTTTQSRGHEFDCSSIPLLINKVFPFSLLDVLIRRPNIPAHKILGPALLNNRAQRLGT